MPFSLEKETLINRGHMHGPSGNVAGYILAKGNHVMINLKIRKTIQANFTADQWELYTESMNCSAAVYTLNEYLEHLVNEGDYDKTTVLNKMMEKMSQLSSYGASDSEPIYFLETVLREIYG